MKAVLLSVMVLVGCATEENDRRDAGGGSGGGCTASSDTCTGDTVCVRSACESAFPRLYEVINIAVTVPTTNLGAAWDVGGGAPDLFVQVMVGASVTHTTAVTADAFTMTASGPYPVTLSSNTVLTLRAFDEDVTTNDVAFDCSSTLNAAQLRQRDLSCTSTTVAGLRLSFTVRPQ